MKWDDIDQQVCSVARSLSVLGERWTLLIIRDAFKGTRRFEGFHRSLGVTRHRLAERLAKLVDEGILTKVAYTQQPERFEYRLTRKGLALYPVLMSLSHWGDQWMSGDEPAPLSYWHSRCAHSSEPQLSCSHCNEPLRPEEVSTKLGSALSAYVDACIERGEPVPADAELPRLVGEKQAKQKDQII